MKKDTYTSKISILYYYNKKGGNKVVMKLNQIKDMYIDSEMEYEYNSEEFGNWFVDIEGIYEKLVNINSPKCIVIGRKGTGKTAYVYKIKDELGQVNNINLSGLNYNFLQDNYKSNDISDAVKYIDFWKIILYFELYKDINYSNKNLNYMFKQIGLSKTADINENVSNMKTGEIEVSFKGLKGNLKNEKSVKKLTAGNLLNLIENEILDLNVETKIVTLDGLDRLLKYNKSEVDIIGGLVNATKEINIKLRKSSYHGKIIIFLRDDMVSRLNDTDMNKIIRDCSVQLNWFETKSRQLMEIFENRIENLNSNWYKLYPKNCERQESFQYFLERTMYRPRDIVEFIRLSKDLYPEKSNLEIIEFKNVLKHFSTEYFYEEMKNELTGFIDEKIIDKLDVLLRQTISQEHDKSFRFQWFEDNFNEEFKNSNVDQGAKDVLEVLFLRGYIGFIRYNRKENKQYVNFKHKDPRLKLDLSKSLLLHQGLYQAVKVSY